MASTTANRYDYALVNPYIQRLPFQRPMPTLFVDNLTVIDFSYVHATRGILGESWIVDIVLTGDLDEQGMVFDFSDVKKQIKQAIDEHYDHKLWIPLSLPKLEKQTSDTEAQYRWQDTRHRNFFHRSPPDAVVEVRMEEINRDDAAVMITEELSKLLPTQVQSITLQLRQEAIAGASYQYSHGLQKHGGNCQRIAHGHRSAIEIYRDQQRDEQLEQQWAEQWRDIYIGSHDHIQSQHGDSMSFLYVAQQGEFELSLPTPSCYLIDTESTVEQIAKHIATTLKEQYPESSFTVKAFEGVAKGSIASA